jgi:hypothetical protein
MRDGHVSYLSFLCFFWTVSSAAIFDILPILAHVPNFGVAVFGVESGLRDWAACQT